MTGCLQAHHAPSYWRIGICACMGSIAMKQLSACCAGVYFAASAFVCAVCFLLYACILPRLAFVQYHRKKSKAAVQSYIMQPPAPRPATQLHGSTADPDSKDDADREGILTDQEVLLTSDSHFAVPCVHLLAQKRSICCYTFASVFTGID